MFAEALNCFTRNGSGWKELLSQTITNVWQQCLQGQSVTPATCQPAQHLKTHLHQNRARPDVNNAT